MSPALMFGPVCVSGMDAVEAPFRVALTTSIDSDKLPEPALLPGDDRKCNRK